MLYASDIPYSASTVAAGVDTLAVNVEADGNIINVQVLQDIPTLTSPALVAVHDWRYVPATLNGKHVPSTLLVHVAFDPPYLQLKNVPLAPVGPFQPLDPKAAPYTPPQLLAATFPPYPPEGRVGGAVVLDVHLDSGGGQSSATFLR